MKEIIAIIRPNKMRATKKALDRLGFPALSVCSVFGRGKQCGIASEVSVEINPKVLGQSEFRNMKYVPKRLLFIVVSSSSLDAVVNTILKVNQTGQIGDGKLIVCPVENALRIRTGETGAKALS